MATGFLVPAVNSEASADTPLDEIGVRRLVVHTAASGLVSKSSSGTVAS